MDHKTHANFVKNMQPNPFWSGVSEKMIIIKNAYFWKRAFKDYKYKNCVSFVKIYF